MKAGDLDPGRTVYRRRHCVVHTDRSCPHIRSDVWSVDAGNLHHDTPVCGRCSDEYNHPEKMQGQARHSGNGSAALLEQLDPSDVPGLNGSGERR